jgi:hypothetical protein
MGRQVSLYVRDMDLPLWRRAERYVRARRMSLSGLIMTALEAYLSDLESQHPPAGTEEL